MSCRRGPSWHIATITLEEDPIYNGSERRVVLVDVVVTLDVSESQIRRVNESGSSLI